MVLHYPVLVQLWQVNPSKKWPILPWLYLKDKEITSKLEIKKTDLDLSFDAFWNTYNNKVGKKKMAESSWNNLSKANKIKALMAIPRYNNNLRLNPGIQKAYPTTFINQEYYNNEY